MSSTSSSSSPPPLGGGSLPPTSSSALATTTIKVAPFPADFTPHSECGLPGGFTSAGATAGSSPSTVTLEDGNFCNRNGYSPGCLPLSYAAQRLVVQDSTSVATVVPIISVIASCPIGYEDKCTFVASGVSTVRPDPPTNGVVNWSLLGVTETAYGCCPRGYTCADIGYCQSSFSGETTYSIKSCATMSDAKITFKAGSTGIQRATQLIYMRPVSNSSSSRPNSIPPPPPPAATPQQVEGSSIGLSAGFQAAIAIASILGVIIAGVGVYFLFRYRKRNRVEKNMGAASIADEEGGQPKMKLELEGDSEQSWTVREADGTSRKVFEMPGSHAPELAHDAFAPAEVDADSSRIRTPLANSALVRQRPGSPRRYSF